jgi:hypothetical protein
VRSSQPRAFRSHGRLDREEAVDRVADDSRPASDLAMLAPGLLASIGMPHGLSGIT